MEANANLTHHTHNPPLPPVTPGGDSTSPFASFADRLERMDREYREKWNIPQELVSQHRQATDFLNRAGIRFDPQMPPQDLVRFACEQSRRYRERRHQEAIESETRAFLADRGKRYAEASLFNFETETQEQEALLDDVLRFASDITEHIEAGDNLLLFGSSGTGKDHLLAAIICEALRRQACHYIPGPGIGRRLAWMSGHTMLKRFRDFAENETKVMRSLTEPRVLAISDLLPASGPLTDFQAGKLLEVLDERYSEQRPTWVTCNVTDRQDLERRLGVQATDRLCEGGVHLFFSWPSYRRRK